MAPKMIWNAEADAKLFCGVLAQIQNSELKLDYQALAEHMGPDCLIGGVKNRMQRLKAAAKGGAPLTPIIPTTVGDDGPGSTPASASPSEKRKRIRAPHTPISKKPKKENKAKSPEVTPEAEEASTNLKDMAEVLMKCEKGTYADATGKDGVEDTEDEPADKELGEDEVEEDI